MFPIQEVDDVLVAFPANIKHLMPRYEDIPDEFRNMNSTAKWHRLFLDWFFYGLKELKLTPRPGVDENKAIRHISCIMRSFEPKHEHKTAACVFLFNEWFEDATWIKGDKR